MDVMGFELMAFQTSTMVPPKRNWELGMVEVFSKDRCFHFLFFLDVGYIYISGHGPTEKNHLSETLMTHDSTFCLDSPTSRAGQPCVGPTQETGPCDEPIEDIDCELSEWQVRGPFI